MPNSFKFCCKLLLGLFLALASGSAGVAQTAGAANSIETLNVNGLQRSFALERFDVASAPGKLPIIIYLHGVGGDITQSEGPSFDLPFDTLPNIEPVLVARPQGIDGIWNAPASQAGSRRVFLKRLLGLEHAPADDIAFLRSLIGRLVDQDNGDPARVYVVGVSAGGYMAARAACELNDIVTAAAILAATARSAILKNCKDGRPVPILLMVGTTDPHAPYAGSDHDASAPETAWFFATRNGCKTRSEFPIPHVDETVDATVSLITFSQCRDGADVLFYREDGTGHNVPSKAPVAPQDRSIVGTRNADIETTPVVWDFFRNRKLAEP